IETRPRWGLSPNKPHSAAGTRIEAPPSDARAAGTRPAATAAALPPLEPPGERSRFHGLRVTPQVTVSVICPHIASSGRVVLPTITAPAERKRCTISESAAAGFVTA